MKTDWKYLNSLPLFAFSLLILSMPLLGADPQLSPIGKVLDSNVTGLERELVPLADAMPAAKFDFAPTNGEFKGVRNFRQQVGHTAAVIYYAASTVIGEKCPVDIGKDENGPATLKTKEEVVQYLKGAFAYAHKAMAKVNEGNLTEEISTNWGKQTRAFMANVIVWHSFDHYGQMVVYARMNGIIPPASRPQK
jgi:hypothetical protein